MKYNKILKVENLEKKIFYKKYVIPIMIINKYKRINRRINRSYFHIHRPNEFALEREFTLNMGIENGIKIEMIIELLAEDIAKAIKKKHFYQDNNMEKEYVEYTNLVDYLWSLRKKIYSDDKIAIDEAYKKYFVKKG